MHESHTISGRRGTATRAERIGFWIGLVVLGGILAVLPLIIPDALQKGTDTSIVEEEGLFEWLQLPWYLAALAVLWQPVRRCPRDLLGYYLLWLFAFALLIVRESDLDAIFTGYHFYRFNRVYTPEVSAFGKVTAVIWLLTFVVFGAVIVLRHRQVLAGYARLRWQRSHVLFGSALLIGFLAQAFDKYKTIAKHTGVDLQFTFRVYAEEAVEMIVAYLFLWSALALRREARQTDPEDA
ncbi:MAG: hypothetical protein CMJ18_00705 [Phycisphaeraceae bacterium]|nr:hypothetical protein [Phycisphaeraceae bacterium]